MSNQFLEIYCECPMWCTFNIDVCVECPIWVYVDKLSAYHVYRVLDFHMDSSHVCGYWILFLSCYLFWWCVPCLLNYGPNHVQRNSEMDFANIFLAKSGIHPSLVTVTANWNRPQYNKVQVIFTSVCGEISS